MIARQPYWRASNFKNPYHHIFAVGKYKSGNLLSALIYKYNKIINYIVSFLVITVKRINIHTTYCFIMRVLREKILTIGYE